MTDREKVNESLQRLESYSRDPAMTSRDLLFWYHVVRTITFALLYIANAIPERTN